VFPPPLTNQIIGDIHFNFTTLDAHTQLSLPPSSSYKKGIFTSYKGYNLDKCTPKSCHDPIYGNTLAFFLWNGTLIVLEHTCSHLFVFQWAKRTLPIPIISMMVVSCALPVAHWMTYNYIASDFFQNGEFGFPMILRQV